MTGDDNGDGTPRPRGGFTMAVHENKYLTAGATEVVAVLTVTAAGLGRGAAGGADAAEVILLDCSGSMSAPPTKLSTAKKATSAAIDALRDGVWFAVVRGDQLAKMAYPNRPRLERADPRTRAEAKVAVSRLAAGGGTAIGSWLRLADTLLAGRRSSVRHAMLITDGQQQHESRAELDQVLSTCAGHFECDARGIGDGWNPTELRHITSTLNGQTKGVAELAAMVADFRELMGAAMNRVVPDVDLRVRTVATARLREIRQVYPTFMELGAQRSQVDESTASFATGAWGDETREYQLCVEVDPADSVPGEDRLAARIDLTLRDEQADGTAIPPSALILAQWTDDPVLSARLDQKITHYAGQEELGDAVRAGCDAHHSGNWPVAVAQLGRAVRLATASGNGEVLRNLAQLVETVDAEAGVVRLREDVSISKLLATEASTAFTSSDGGRPAHGKKRPPPTGPPRECPAEGCGFLSRPDALVCESCGYRFGTETEGERS